MPQMQDCNFDLIHALENRLEAIQVYDQYIQDAQRGNAPELTQVWQQLKQQDQQVVDTLRQQIVKRVQNNQFQ
jgi:hypothetical protein